MSVDDGICIGAEIPAFCEFARSCVTSSGACCSAQPSACLSQHQVFDVRILSMEGKEDDSSPMLSDGSQAETREMNGLLYLRGPSSKKPLITGFLAAVIVLLFLALGWTIWFLQQERYSVSDTYSRTSFVLLGDCGNDHNTAQKRGCIFDVMLGHWVPPACFDSDMHDSYVNQHNWTWYWDSSFTDPVPKDRVRKGDYAGTWTSLEFHFYHCAYLWQLQLKSFTTGAPLVEYLWTYEHAEHCAQILADQEFPGRNETYVETEYGRCISPRLTRA